MTFKRQNGFSLTELLVAMTISLIVLGLVGSLFMKQVSTYGTQDQVVRMHQSGQLAMKVMSREIRTAGYNHRLAAPAFCPFTSVTGSNSITFKRYSTGFVKTTFNLSNGRLRRIVNGTVKQSFGNISSVGFTYRDASGAPTSVHGAIRQVEITLVARTARSDKDYAPNDGYRTLVLKSTITPRNFSD